MDIISLLFTRTLDDVIYKDNIQQMRGLGAMEELTQRHDEDWDPESDT